MSKRVASHEFDLFFNDKNKENKSKLTYYFRDINRQVFLPGSVKARILSEEV